MAERKNTQSGLLSLEACISVTVFIFLMLFLYSLFIVFEARNLVGHAVLAAANSLSLDAYSGGTDLQSGSAKAVFDQLYAAPLNPYAAAFTDSGKWYENATSEAADGTTVLSADFQGAIESRVLAYLGAGDRQDAKSLLERFHIKDGAAGLDFSGSHMESDDLYLCVTYTIEYEFQVFNLKGVEMKQEVCSRRWQ